MTTMEATFAPRGPIATSLAGFAARPGQVQMAQLVERGFLECAHTVVEAGTGIGKSLAYLVPALRSGKRVVVSTGTIALQEQLVRKDIPLVAGALGLDPRVVLLKGRSNYLCKLKYERMSGERLIAPTVSMERLWQWAERTRTGDRAELDFVPRTDEWESLDADADDCVGEHCERFDSCWFFSAREAARYADLIVVNHALFFLDLAMGGGLLPSYDYVILDEAHQCERNATAALTATLSNAGIGRMMRRLHRHFTLPTTYDAQIDEAMRRLMRALGEVPGERYPIGANSAIDGPLDDVREALYTLENWVWANWLGALRHPTTNEAEAERRRDLALRAVSAAIGTVDRIAQASTQSVLPADAVEAIAWAERLDGPSYALNAAPTEVASFLRATLFERVPSVVLTSATIADGRSFAFLRETLGVDAAQELIAPSPFDYPSQARLYLASSRLNPKAADFAARAAPIIEECLDRTRGRAFVLFTSYARLRELYAILRERIAYPCRIQGELPRGALLEWFRTTKNAVLFATGTFWEGIDVAGDQLSCVIIDRLPFPSPADPLVAARMAAIEASGRSGFEAYMIPSAIVRLKQGFGRLIRAKSDRGVIALLDGRALGMRYGATIVDALPPARRITDLGEIDELFLPER